MNKSDWKKECLYIQKITPAELAENFNNDQACLNRYIEMQATQCERDGYPDIAASIRAELNY